MRKAITWSLGIVLITLISSFTTSKSEPCIGVYGVSESDPSAIRLELQADNTFSYQDFSISDAKVKVTGTWKQQGNQVRLQSATDQKFHHKWHLEKAGNVIKSRKGMTFLTLCRIK